MEEPEATTQEIASSDDDREALDTLESNLGYSFADPGLLDTALRHRSFVHQFKDKEDVDQLLEDNQRFEFLGDAVLGLCISTLLYDEFPDDKEGTLSRMRAGLVNESRLANLAREIGVSEALFLGRGEETTGGRDKNSILADALEAIMAAVYLDGGYEAAFMVVDRLWGDLIVRAAANDLLRDYKTQLQERTQRDWGLTPQYHLTGSEGPDHARTFEITLYLGNRAVSTGRGRSKKSAEQAAARSALEMLDAHQPE